MIGTKEERLQEGEVDPTVTPINMHGASESGKTCTQLLTLAHTHTHRLEGV